MQEARRKSTYSIRQILLRLSIYSAHHRAANAHESPRYPRKPQKKLSLNIPDKEDDMFIYNMAAKINVLGRGVIPPFLSKAQIRITTSAAILNLTRDLFA